MARITVFLRWITYPKNDTYVEISLDDRVRDRPTKIRSRDRDRGQWRIYICLLWWRLRSRVPPLNRTRSRCSSHRDENTNIMIVTHVYRCPLPRICPRTCRSLQVIHVRGKRRTGHNRTFNDRPPASGGTPSLSLSRSQNRRPHGASRDEMHTRNCTNWTSYRAPFILSKGKGKKCTSTCADAPLTPAPAQLADDGIAHRSLRRPLRGAPPSAERSRPMGGVVLSPSPPQCTATSLEARSTWHSQRSWDYFVFVVQGKFNRDRRSSWALLEQVERALS